MAEAVAEGARQVPGVEVVIKSAGGGEGDGRKPGAAGTT
jgi:hypothetical protein